MKTKLLFLAAMATFALTSCVNDEFIGDPAASELGASDGSINFGFKFPNMTRGDIVGSAAADLLGKGFYVAGTKGTEQSTTPSTKLVFDNYLVHYGVNTAGTTESNTANWEYVGVTPGSSPYEQWVKLSPLTVTNQTIKYWDYSEAQYDFLAFSTGSKNAVKKTAFSGGGALTDDEIGVTAMAYGENLDDGAAYTFYIPTIEGLQNTYITDIITVAQANYGKEVKLTFKNLGAKIRLALYETVPGYSVKDVKFYTVDKADDAVDDLAGVHTTTATLISADGTYGFSTKGTAVVSFPKLGLSNNSNGNYKKASVNVTPVAPADPGDVVKTQTFGTLDYKTDKQGSEAAGTIYLGRNVTEATFAGKSAVDYYQVVFPVTNSKPLTLRVDYTLVSTDGTGETINVYGAKAVVPSTYTVWQPNYAYTYIFKISDNTNGWTDTDHTKAGLFPITFDAVVAEIKDASGEQRTITTVATPSITTYQQGHDKAKDEYSQTSPDDKDIYVQVMDNTTAPGTLVTDLNGTTPTDGTARSLLYLLSDDDATEAMVMDALENRISELATADVTGRNGLTLTKDANIDATVTQILNGVDDKPITQIEGVNITAGKVVKLDISELTAGKTYAYVYDYSDAAKTTKSFYQPTGAAVGSTIGDGVKYIGLDDLKDIVLTTSGSEAADDSYIYFSKTTTDGVNYTYSYYSVDGKTGNLPAGLLKVSKSTDLSTGNGTTTKVVAGDFVFDIYKRNTGKYAVKVIKIVA